MNPTTRRFSRTLADAFADERAGAIYAPPSRFLRKAQEVCFAIVLGGIAGVILTIALAGG